MEPRKHYFAKIPTIAIFIVMAMSGPLGVLLFILKGIDQKVQKEEQEAARAQGDYRPDLGPEPDRKSEPVYGHDVPTEAQKSAKQWHKNIATLCTIMGAVFLLAGVTNHQCVEVLARPRGAVFQYCHGHWRRRCAADRPADEEHPQAGTAAG